MNFLNKESKDCKWIKPLIGTILAFTYVFANFTSTDMIIKAIPFMVGMEITTAYYILLQIFSAGFNFLIFYLLARACYTMSYRMLVNSTKDWKAMPVSGDSFMNHLMFVMIFANLIIGGIGLILRYNLIYMSLVDMFVRLVVKALAYVMVLLLLKRVGVGENVGKKLFGGCLVPMSVLLVLMV